MSNALIIFSGGQDSTTCLYWAKSRYEQIFAVTFDYGQRHRNEIESARRIASLNKIEHELIDMGPIFAGLSPLTNSSKQVEKYDSVSTLPGGLENTFVPGRNILFLSVAANRAYVLGCDDIVIGVSQEDYGGYPDCRLDFIKSMQAALACGLDREFRIQTPLIDLTKRETVELARELPGCFDALALTTTCYDGSNPPCLQCHSCLLRQKGFSEAGFPDPLLAGVI